MTNAFDTRAIAHKYWGDVQQQKTILRGVTEYSTSGHGGIIVDSNIFNIDRIPQRFFCSNNKSMGIFEEDCDYAILLYFYKDIAKAYYNSHAYLYSRYKTFTAFYNNCVVDTVKLFYPEFLQAAAKEVVI